MHSKCSEQKLEKKIFFTSSLGEYLYDRINSINNKFEFYFQGRSLDLELKSKDDIIEININKNFTNITFNKKNIFNFKIMNILNENKNMHYTFYIEKNILYVFLNKNNNIIKCLLDDMFTIDKIGIKTTGSNGFWVI